MLELLYIFLTYDRMSRSLSRNSRHSKGAEEKRSFEETMVQHSPFTHQTLLGTERTIFTVPTF